MSIIPISGGPTRATPILLSSDTLDARDRFDAWREELMLRVVRVDVDVPDRKSFHTRLRVLALASVSIIERRTTPSTVRRTAELARDGDDALVFTLPWRNSVELRGGGDQGRAGSGEAIIASMAQATSLHAPNGFRGVSLRLDRSAARSVASGVEQRLNQRIPLDPMGSALLRSYLVFRWSRAGPGCRHRRLSSPTGRSANFWRICSIPQAILPARKPMAASGPRGSGLWSRRSRRASPIPTSAPRRWGGGSDCLSAMCSSCWSALASLFRLRYARANVSVDLKSHVIRAARVATAVRK
jgi:AraC-binding-like domain